MNLSSWGCPARMLAAWVAAFAGSLAAATWDSNAHLWRLEIGFMEQTLQQRGGRVWEANHTLTVWLFSDAPLGR